MFLPFEQAVYMSRNRQGLSVAGRHSAEQRALALRKKRVIERRIALRRRLGARVLESAVTRCPGYNECLPVRDGLARAGLWLAERAGTTREAVPARVAQAGEGCRPLGLSLMGPSSPHIYCQ